MKLSNKGDENNVSVITIYSNCKTLLILMQIVLCKVLYIWKCKGNMSLESKLTSIYSEVQFVTMTHDLVTKLQRK